MQLQKLVFLAHGLSLALTDEALTYHNVHAWQWGPVLPKLYKVFSSYGANPIISPAKCDEIVSDQKSNSIISSVWTRFGNFSGPKLSAITHQPNSPWDITWKSNQYGVIPNELIKSYYSKQLESASA